MSEDIRKFIEEQKAIIAEEKRKLQLEFINVEENEDEKENCDKLQQHNNNEIQSIEFGNSKILIEPCVLSPNANQKLLSTNKVNINSNEGIVEKSKQAFIDNLSDCDNPLRSDDINRAMLRYGEYSPNNPQLRVTAAPYLGLGEYEQRRNIFLQKQKAEYLRHLAQKSQSLKEVSKSITSEKASVKETKAVQTEIQNIHTELIQYGVSQNLAEKELSPTPVNNYLPLNNRNLASYRVDQRLTSAQNALLKTDMDKPKGILSNRRTGSPRERLLSDLKHSYTPSFMDGFSYQATRSEELERERLKREAYQQELRMQIEEKRRMQAMRDEQERREQELENRRLEQQLLRMQEEQLADEQRKNRNFEHMRRHSEELFRRQQDVPLRGGLRKHTESESGLSGLSREPHCPKPPHYSPPVARRHHYPPGSSTSSYNVPSTSVFEPTTVSSTNTFSRFDSLSRIDSLTQRMDTALSLREGLGNGQRRHSATQQDLSAFRRSPKLQRRGSSGRFDDTLPVPVLKAHSPVAKELRNSVPFNSARHGSDAVRRLEDKWQIPAVQKNIVNHYDSSRDSNRSILTQLGAIRMQLQQEQLRMDESLRKRGYTQSKAVDFHSNG
ncbi:putative autophagy-related protein 11 isoform X3 [Aethina tumida]|uniref:putative autophagy-related protein 11 isoform X3 n=1 Tax=Aethina tumida TaxID=116153 RepID=UPI002147A488|nr:putative autophagy-related protein 11 isoform X3 [Aethina tumida]